MPRYDTFNSWFLETVGYGAREESFWEAISYRDNEAAYKFLITAWKLGYEAGRRAEGTLKNYEDSESEAPPAL